MSTRRLFLILYLASRGRRRPGHEPLRQCGSPWGGPPGVGRGHRGPPVTRPPLDCPCPRVTPAVSWIVPDHLKDGRRPPAVAAHRPAVQPPSRSSSRCPSIIMCPLPGGATLVLQRSQALPPPCVRPAGREVRPTRDLATGQEVTLAGGVTLLVARGRRQSWARDDNCASAATAQPFPPAQSSTDVGGEGMGD